MKDWRAIRLCPDASIRDAMRVIDAGAVGVALICADDERLLGTVSDGDIRRALLADREMADPAYEVANLRPRSAPAGTDRIRLLDMLRRHSITLLPLLDDAGRVVEVWTMPELLERPQLDNPVFIMAGGFGTRLHPLTAQTPKPMLKVGDRPMLQHLIERFVRQGFTNLYVSTHYLPERIHDHFGDGSAFGARITYVHEETPLGTGGALGLLPRDLPKLPLLMINGDVLTNVDFVRLLRSHERGGRLATMCVREYEYQVPYGVVQSADEVVTGMVEKPVHRYHVNTGIYVLDPEIATGVRPGTRIDMPSLLEQVVGDGGEVGIYSSFDYWLDIGRIEDYERAQQDVRILELA